MASSHSRILLPQLDSNRMLVFGGLDKRTRFNDVWVLDVDEKAWKQIEVAADEEKGCPEARAHFTATRCGKKIFIFGGYGGNGQVYSDLWCLTIGDEGQFSWQDLTATIEGTGPTPRFDHSAFICECMQQGAAGRMGRSRGP
jgi:dynein heavy chain